MLNGIERMCYQDRDVLGLSQLCNSIKNTDFLQGLSEMVKFLL